MFSLGDVFMDITVTISLPRLQNRVSGIRYLQYFCFAGAQTCLGKRNNIFDRSSLVKNVKLIKLLKERIKNNLIFSDLTPYLFWISKKKRNDIINMVKKR